MTDPHTFLQAVQAGERTRVEALVAQNPALVNVRGAGGLPAVLVALYYGQGEIAELLAEHGADLDVFSAAALGNVSRLEDLLAAHPEQVNAVAVDGFQPLGLASFFGRFAAARLLLERGAEVDAPSHNPMRVTPLHSAVAGGHVDIARLLLDHGADPNARQADEFTPLHGAAQNGQGEMIRLLLERGADPHAANAQGISVLDYAHESGSVEAVRLLEDC